MGAINLLKVKSLMEKRKNKFPRAKAYISIIRSEVKHLSNYRKIKEN